MRGGRNGFFFLAASRRCPECPERGNLSRGVMRIAKKKCVLIRPRANLPPCASIFYNKVKDHTDVGAGSKLAVNFRVALKGQGAPES